MPPQRQSRFWRRVRLLFRTFRVTVLLAILALLGVLIYLNLRGLPEFVQRPLLEKLRARGLELQVSRLRWAFYRGVVADNVKFGGAESTAGLHLTARTVDVNIDYLALLKGQLQLTGVVLDQGRFAWSLADSNEPPRYIVVERIQAGLRLLPGDQWALDYFHALFTGADFSVSGAITNASAIRDWPILHTRQPAGAAHRRLQRFADTLEQIHFESPPSLRLVLNGDARDLKSFTALFTLSAPDADTPWGKIARGVFTTRLLAATETGHSHAEIKLQAYHAETPWANVSDLALAMRFAAPAGQTNLVNADLTLKISEAESRWANATNLLFTANWIHSLTNAIPLSGHGELLAATAATKWISGQALHATATLATPSNPPPADSSWAWWTNLQPYHLDWACEWSQLRSEKLDADKLVCGGRWLAPHLTVTNLHMTFPEGTFDARAALNVATRDAQFDLNSSFDAQKISPLLPEKARRWLGRFTWHNPPVVAGSGAVILPAWTNHQPDWRGEVLPTLRLNGQFAVTNGTYLGMAADYARSHITYSNMIWHLPDLEAGRPEGRLRLEHRSNDRTHAFYYQVHSTVDPRVVRPLLDTNAQRGFDLFTSEQPPVIDGEVWGRSAQPDLLGAKAHVTVKNFSFRGETASHFDASLRYTNRVLEFLDPHLLRGTQSVVAAGVTADFNADRIYFTNGFSTAEPLVIARGIGPQTGATLERYHFRQPPRVRVNGFAPLHGSHEADLYFEVEGGEFETWRFTTPRIAALVHWMGDTLELTNVQADFCGGSVAGFAHFDFSVAQGAQFGFSAEVTDASLPLLLAGISHRTNNLEGKLSGRLTITDANSTDFGTWNGYGRARLRNGYLWEIPIFGVLSQPLDAIIPGVASTRFTEASARYGITNSVITWSKLEMRAPTMRLQYDGTVDFDGRVDMRVEAEPLRDTWLVGRIFSLALWPVSKFFQYKITGTLDHPKSEPVYIPTKLLMIPLHPFQTLESIFSSEPEKTNAQPTSKPEEK